eukprot:SAG31_NODE_6969_length_1831_cov_5.879908_1_plen_303_part_00
MPIVSPFVPCLSSSSPTTTIVLLHGNGIGLLSFERLADKLHNGLATAADVLSIDLFGHGGTGSPDCRHSQDELARFVSEVLSQLRIDHPVWIVGHSTGGFVAAAFTRCFPTKCAGVVLLAPSGLTLPSPLGAMLSIARTCACCASCVGGMMGKALSSPSEALKDEWADETNFPAFVVEVEHELASYDRAAWKRSMGKICGDFTDYGGASGEQFYAASAAASKRLPTLIIWGDQDGAAPAADATLLFDIYQRERSRELCEMVTIPGAKHLVLLEHAETIATTFVAFKTKFDTTCASGNSRNDA